MRLAVCMKWVDTRPEIDPLTGDVSDDRRWFAASRADQTALETALTLGDHVTVVCAGPPVADQLLRDSLAAGADRAVRVDVDPAADSAAVAAAVAPVIAGSDIVICGDWSLDRGTGSFPAFLAHHLEAAQALGCTQLSAAAGGGFEAVRRLDGGRRERVGLTTPAVVSVEAGQELRRAGLKSVLAAASAPVEVVTATVAADHRHQVVATGPFRPRSREIRPPEGDDPRLRLMSVSGAMVKPSPNQALKLDPEAAADLLIERLAQWGIGIDPEPGEPSS